MDNFDYSIIGQRIKTLRKRKGLNQTQLANLIGKSLRTMQKYETGEIEVSIDVVNALAKHLDTTPTFILGYEAARKTSKKVINFFVVGLTYGCETYCIWQFNQMNI